MTAFKLSLFNRWTAGVGVFTESVRLIAPVLNVTRTWNTICALATMRRCLALATDYARRRHVFGRPLIEQPLHAGAKNGLFALFGVIALHNAHAA